MVDCSLLPMGAGLLKPQSSYIRLLLLQLAEHVPELQSLAAQVTQVPPQQAREATLHQRLSSCQTLHLDARHVGPAAYPGHSISEVLNIS
jgi:hypothetical protein